ncbi:sigma 54-interacting transcriptional regulator [Bacillus sp. FJAT-51639]|uniref:Sigma 54-interacting transcriptional regulator n=1 Tax=Bacillus bruguierae TaxID=3127667 RepID=A0ABU8FL84_9BACI
MLSGAYTGVAKGDKPGKIELVDGGTLFLDEVWDCTK